MNPSRLNVMVISKSLLSAVAFVTTTALFAQPTPCVNPTPLNPGSGYGLLNVTLNTLNHNTPSEEGFSTEYDSLATITNLSKCQTYTLDITSTGAPNSNAFAWIDWNEDGDFDDAREDYGTITAGASHTANITVPFSAPNGNKFMRVTSVFKFNFGPCAALFSDFGDVEDYRINVVEDDMVVDSVTVEQANYSCYLPGSLC